VHVEIQRDRHDVQIARALAIAEQRPFDAVRARRASRVPSAATPVQTVIVRVAS